MNYKTCSNWSNNRWKFVVSKLVDGSGEQVTCPTKMSSIEQLIVIYLDNRSVFHKDNFFFSLDFFVLFYENRFYMPLHNWILQIALIVLKIGSNETNVVSEENVLLIGSINQFRNYELWIFMSFMTNQNNFLQLCLATCYCCCFCPKNLIGFLNFFLKIQNL